MGLLETFMSTWSQARQTFGQGAPAGGTQFDASASLRQMQAEVETAAPGTQWSGDAAAAYEARNAEHAQMFGKLAELDTQLAAEIDKSAYIVASGRTELDNVRDWVAGAASSIPNTPAGEAMLMPIVSKGMADISDVILKSHGELSAIGVKIQQLGAEYSALTVQK